jgi:hypothetical protein
MPAFQYLYFEHPLHKGRGRGLALPLSINCLRQAKDG